jgi:beta-hydroxylase
MFSALIFLSCASLIYVYRVRGVTRFSSFSEYLRKGWPIFAPFNCAMYIFTKRAWSKPVLNMSQFPALTQIAENWQVIRDEALTLHEKDVLNETSSDNSLGRFDVGFRTFKKYGWRKFYLTWYGVKLRSANNLCPRTTEIISSISCINGAMFAYLPPHSQLTRHLDPLAVSLRFHFGLATPNDDRCYINVDGNTVSWRDGKGFVFDETYLHFVRNDTDHGRLILMCDVERPVWGVGKVFLAIYKIIAKGTIVPNLPGDQRGLGNIIFSSVEPMLLRGKALKAESPTTYAIVKYALNATLILVPIVLLFVAANLFF